MPHLRLEHSANIRPSIEYITMFEELHALMVETKEFKLNDIKSRAVVHQNFLVGNDPTCAFVHLELACLEGRPESLRATLSQGLRSILQKYFIATGQSNCSYTVEIREMHRGSYSKI